MVGYAQGVGDDCQSGVYRSAGREKARVDDVKIVHLVGPAIWVQRRCLWIAPEADGPVLVRDSGQWNAVADEEISREQSLMAIVTVLGALRLLPHQLSQLLAEQFVSLFVVRTIVQHNLAVAVECDPVIGVRKIFGRQP